MRVTEFGFTAEHLVVIRTRLSLRDEDWEIAARIGCDLGTFHTICSKHGYTVRDSRNRVPHTVAGLNDKTRRAFAAAAVVRNTTPARLMADCLEVIAKDGLFLAVLGK